MRVLLVEDDPHTAAFIGKGLREDGHTVEHAGDGRTGLFLATTETFDAIVLDRMLPALDGLVLLQTLRGAGNRTPLLLLTALGEVDHRVEGLRAGADDYLVKPFAFDELVARIDALGRRLRGQPAGGLQVGDLRIDTRARQVLRAGRKLELRRREYMLLTYLVARKGEIVTPIEIEDQLYAGPDLPASNSVASAVCALREELERGGLPRLIHTRRGLGYVFEEAPA